MTRPPTEVRAASAGGDAVVTICTANYLHYARALARSIREQHADLPVWACVVDVPTARLPAEREPLQLFAAEQLPIAGWRRFAFQYRPLELCAALEPWAVEYLLDALGCRRVLYLDCDMQAYAPLTPLFAALDDCELMITPHLTAPLPDDGRIPDEMQILRTGAYNGGFLGIRHTPTARQMLAWWQAKLRRDCVLDVANHRYANQRYLDLVPTLFDGVRIERDPGCNAAYWNMPPRRLEFTADDRPQIDGRPLRFFHFSNFNPDRPDELTTHANRLPPQDLPVVRKLLQAYVERLDACGRRESQRLSYGFATLTGGRPIRDGWRTAVRLQHPALADIVDPFDDVAVKHLARRLTCAAWSVRWGRHR